jgi:hypothetical protein
VGIVCRYIEKTAIDHLAAVKHKLWYVSGTLKLGCFYKKKSEGVPVRLYGYSDSDMAGDLDDKKSMTGVIFYLGSSPISWLSRKQKVVALSSCEAKACQGIWLGRMLGKLIGTDEKQGNPQD